VSEFLKIFETLGSVTVEQLLAFAALIVPGFISLRVYEMRRGGEGRKINDVLIDRRPRRTVCHPEHGRRRVAAA
jgi:hypothetical protein